MRRLTRSLSGTFIGLMVLLGMFGVGLWALAKISEIAGRTGAAPIAVASSRYRRFATTGG